MCWCSGFAGGFLGAPWLMLLPPVIFLVVMFLVCRAFRPHFAGFCGCGPHRHWPGNNWAKEISDLRRDVDDLQKSSQKP